MLDSIVQRDTIKTCIHWPVETNSECLAEPKQGEIDLGSTCV